MDTWILDAVLARLPPDNAAGLTEPIASRWLALAAICPPSCAYLQLMFRGVTPANRAQGTISNDLRCFFSYFEPVPGELSFRFL
jgi:hypothetical protein